MKNIFMVALLSVTIFSSRAQTGMNCCAPSATEAFARNAGDRAFLLSHPLPLPFVYQSARGKDITYQTPDGKNAHAWEIKAKKPTDYYMIVIHEWWGLNDYIKQESEKISNDLGINVLALDLYDNQVASTREDAAKYMSGVKTDRALAIIRGAYTYLGSEAKVFTSGWCFGGGWSLQTALEGGKQVRGCVMFYGMPEKSIDRLKTLNCDVIGFFGEKDKWITPAVVSQFEADMKSAGKNLQVTEYNADHAFANPSNPVYDKAATADSYAKMLAFVRERMK
jgi:carboxymethylenebutenolidase